MSTITESHSILRASLRLFAALALFGVMLVMNPTTTSAQQCDMALGCTSVQIANCTWPPMVYDVEFLLCCGGLQVINPIVNVPPALGPGQCFSFIWAPPAGCTVIGVWNIMPPPPLGWSFDPTTCTLTMF